MSEADTNAPYHTISDVERDVGVAKETLRVWERRYGFPRPSRDHNGERTYPAVQVERLARIKRLIDHGHRPGKLMVLDDGALASLGAGLAVVTPGYLDDPEVAACMAMLRSHQAEGLRTRLVQALLRRGLREFVTRLAAPLTTAVGNGWAEGTLAIFEEHMFAETMQHVLRAAIDAAARPDNRDADAPRILLTTVPQERHALGLMMAEALCALEGACCVSLGPQTPLADIVAAAAAHRSDIVALSFSSQMSSRAVADSIQELRYRFGTGVQVWAGGSGAHAARRLIGPDTVVGLEDIGAAIARWKARRGAPASPN